MSANLGAGNRKILLTMFGVIKPSIWAYALIRRVEVGGAYAVVAKRGDADAGAVLVNVCTLDGQATLYLPIRNMEGTRVWLPKGPLPEREINELIGKRVKMDPDIWVVEIEDKQNRHFLTEPIED